MGKIKRRNFTPEQKTEAVKIFRDSGKRLTTVAKELGLTASSLSLWVKQAGIDSGGGSQGMLTSDEKNDLARQRREIKRLTQENAFLKKASAFFAKESL